MKTKTVHLIDTSLSVFLGIGLIISSFPIKAIAEKPSIPNINIMLLAAGERSTILTTTPVNNTINHNGSEWYNNTRSLGFANAGSLINQSSTDLNNPSDPLRLSWRRTNTLIAGGTRLGTLMNLNNSTSYMRMVFEANTKPGYYPSGPQTNVDINSLNGWSLCYFNYYNEITTPSILWNSCSGDYLLLAGTTYTDLAHNVDIIKNGTSVLYSPGSSMDYYKKLYEGDSLDIQLYEPDGITTMNWDSFKLFTELCEGSECSNRNTPVADPDSWDDGVLIGKNFTVPIGSARKTLAIYPADDVTGDIIKTSGSPFLLISGKHMIDNCESLAAIDESYERDYITLSNDLDCSGIEFKPLMPDPVPFIGVFDGNNKTISNLSIVDPSGYGVAMFAYTEFAEFKNLKLKNVSVEGSYQVGTIVSNAYGLTMKNISVENALISSSGECESIGGLAGYLDNDGDESLLLNNLHFYGTINAQDCDKAGGLFGEINGAKVSNSGSNGSVNGLSNVGGLAGVINSTTIEESSSRNSIVAISSNAGGLVANNVSGNIKRSYALGNVKGIDNVGGLVGHNDGIIEDSYSTGFTEGNNVIGGLVGQCSGSISNSYSTGLVDGIIDEYSGGLVGSNVSCAGDNNYWDIQTSGTIFSSFGIGKLTSQLLSSNTYEDVSWNFDEVWKIDIDVNGGYPCHIWDEIYCINDGDNISTKEENSGPNNGDGNNDGILDSLQSNVTSYVNTINTKYVTLAFDNECKTTQASSILESNTLKDSGFDYPDGLVSFTTNCQEEEKILKVDIYYHGKVIPDLPLRKYNPLNGAYFNLEEFTKTAVEFNGNSASLISYHIKEGSELDMDGIINGTIVDPIGFGQIAVQVPNTGFGYLQK